MKHAGRVLVAGLGSPHGDDQAGWLVADNIAEQFRSDPDVVVRRAMIPLDVLDWLGDVDVLHICDACETTQSQADLRRFTWGAGQFVDSKIPQAADIGSFNRVLSGPREERHAGWIPQRGALPTRLNECDNLNWCRARGSHDFGLPDVLRLAEKTGLLPKQVIVWAIAGNRFQPSDFLSDTTRITAFQVADEIMKELRGANA